MESEDRQLAPNESEKDVANHELVRDGHHTPEANQDVYPTTSLEEEESLHDSIVEESAPYIYVGSPFRTIYNHDTMPEDHDTNVDESSAAPFVTSSENGVQAAYPTMGYTDIDPSAVEDRFLDDFTPVVRFPMAFTEEPEAQQASDLEPTVTGNTSPDGNGQQGADADLKEVDTEVPYHESYYADEPRQGHTLLLYDERGFKYCYYPDTAYCVPFVQPNRLDHRIEAALARGMRSEHNVAGGAVNSQGAE